MGAEKVDRSCSTYIGGARRPNEVLILHLHFTGGFVILYIKCSGNHIGDRLNCFLFKKKRRVGNWWSSSAPGRKKGILQSVQKLSSILFLILRDGVQNSKTLLFFWEKFQIIRPFCF